LDPLQDKNNSLKIKMASLDRSVQQIFADLEDTISITKFVNCLTLSDCNETSLVANITANMSSFGALR
jgi:hypothetical protein